MPVVKYNGITLNLGGIDYVLPPISLGALEQLQSRIGSFNGDVMDSSQITTVIDAAHASLLRNYPDITRPEVAEMIDVGNMSDVFAAVMDVSGLKRKELAEATPAGEAVAG
jgi:hypothetical protein